MKKSILLSFSSLFAILGGTAFAYPPSPYIPHYPELTVLECHQTPAIPDHSYSVRILRALQSGTTRAALVHSTIAGPRDVGSFPVRHVLSDAAGGPARYVGNHFRLTYNATVTPSPAGMPGTLEARLDGQALRLRMYCRFTR